jgi:hypothetical protein
MIQKAHSSSLRTLLTMACFISGLLAGGDIYRYVIEVPAWRQMNIRDWGDYSRHADLENGIFLFPFEAISSSILLLICSILVIRNKEAFRSAAPWIHASTVLALVGLGLTFLAAPYVLSVGTIGDDPGALQYIFKRFHFWGLLRAIAQVLSFFMCVLALKNRRMIIYFIEGEN